MTASRPRRFDANVIVIGAGSAGLVSAYIAAALKSRVILIEAGTMGGDCLNTGCVPSKALIAAARRAHQARQGEAFGLHADVEVHFSRVMAHVRTAIDTIAPNDSAARYERLGVHCVSGQARLVDPWTVTVGSQRYTGRSIVIATGAEPALPPIPGLEKSGFLTSDTLWSLESLPGRLAVLGGGPIGCELAQAFSRLGSRVNLFEMQDRMLGAEDPAVGETLARRFRAEGIGVNTATRVTAIEPGGLQFDTRGETGRTDFDHLLVATGRRPRISGFGLEELGVAIVEGRVGVNPFLQTNYPHIYACGDVVGPYQFTHAASHQAWHCAVNALFAPFKRFRVSYDHLPWAIYTDPEVARVGLNESEAAHRGVRVESTVFPMEELDRAITEGEREGFVKLLTRPRSDRIIGATIVGTHAGEMISTVTLAMKHGIGINKMLATIVPYPAWSESLKRASGAWKAANAPAWVFPWLTRFHRFRRGK